MSDYETDQDVGIGVGAPTTGSGQGTVPGSTYESDQDVGINPANKSYAQALGTGVLGGIPGARTLATTANAALSYLPGNPNNPEIQGLPFGQRVSALQKRYDQSTTQSAQEHPYIQTGASLATGAALIPGAAMSTLPRAMATGAATGAVYGADQGDSVDDRLNRAAWGAGLGAVGGAGGYGAGKVIGPAVGATADAANRLGVPMPRYMMSNPVVQRVGTNVQSLPLVGDLTRGAANKATETLSAKVQNLGRGITPENAGTDIGSSLNNWIEKSNQLADRRYAYAAAQLDPTVTTPLTNTNALIAQMQQQAAARGSTLSGADLAQIANANTMPGGLTYSAIKDLRTTINQMKPTWGNVNPDPAVSARISRLHGALSQDLDAAAQNADRTGRGFQAHQDASQFYKTIQGTNEALTPLIGPQGDIAPEQVFANLYRKAGDNPSSADINLLRQAKTAVQNSSTPQAWDTFEQGVINRLGVGKSGFTPDMYLNHYSSIPDSAKDVLFSPANRAVLDDATTVAQKMKQAGFAKNPSGTGHVIGGGLAGLGLYGLAEHAPEIMEHPGLAIGALAGGIGVGRAMTAPVTGPNAVRNYLAQQLARRVPTVAAGQFGSTVGGQP